MSNPKAVKRVIGVLNSTVMQVLLMRKPYTERKQYNTCNEQKGTTIGG